MILGRAFYLIHIFLRAILCIILYTIINYRRKPHFLFIPCFELTLRCYAEFVYLIFLRRGGAFFIHPVIKLATRLRRVSTDTGCKTAGINQSTKLIQDQWRGGCSVRMTHFTLSLRIIQRALIAILDYTSLGNKTPKRADARA